LDEIGDMPAELQTRLLRVIADGEFYRVGGHTPLRVDVRIIAATHQDLETRVREGGFREDLFHRLNVIRLHVPPLRERREDVPILAQHFLTTAAAELGVETKLLLPETTGFLEGRDWPGNVRQLENVCRWLTVMASGSEIMVEDLPPEIRTSDGASVTDQSWEQVLVHWAERGLAAGDTGLLREAVVRVECLLIEAALRHTGGRRQDAAKLLGWGRNTLTRKIKEHSIDA